MSTLTALGAMLCTQAALAQTQPAPASSSPGDTTKAASPAGSIGREPLTLNTGATQDAKPFGTEGTRWLEFGGLVADNFKDSVDTNLHARFSEFIATDVELGGELAGWSFNQPGDNAVGGSLVLIVRWHFLNRGDWSLYADAGVGGMVASDDTPDSGTSFNLMPRAGAGFTRAIGGSGARLELGVRWHHISNARITGDDHNPSRDSLALYLGFAIPFK
ncbi:MAG: acyloxyacyl hydrolase [Phycisphaerales bacterium]|nr:acyloxyacyl hydrolase [Phycisphaerales bacterium]